MPLSYGKWFKIDATKDLNAQSELVVYILPRRSLTPKFLRWGFQGGATTAIAVVGLMGEY